MYCQFRELRKAEGKIGEKELQKFRELTKALPIATCRVFDDDGGPSEDTIGIASIPQSAKGMTGTGRDWTGTGWVCFEENTQWAEIRESVVQAISDSGVWVKGMGFDVRNLGVWYSQLKDKGDYGTDAEKMPTEEKFDKLICEVK